ncbi:MAG: putative DNA modification/repair radical SAM protein [Oscillospiraceae bacterium]|jgi:putative DNA modification/repair radical SAM protein|nr:putative DNA modification/repair radical SAM protein [Oscillospiraceae bacterium]
MDILGKLTLLADSAKYDAACTSSGAARRPVPRGGIGNTAPCGICHSFSADGRCITLLKVLMTNACVYDCQYCVNRASHDTPRTAFTPEELSELTIQFYRRNYIEGLFLSSGVLKNADYTMERMIKTVELLRHRHRFGGYIHAKAIPGASPALVEKMGLLVDRMSINIELPSEGSLNRLAPDKSRRAILRPMAQISQGQAESAHELMRYQHAPRFAPAGQSTQMIIGASPESDYQIVRLAAGLYQQYGLKRVFYSAYIPVSDSSLLPSPETRPPLLREHRLYQADWLLRMYHFQPEEILSEAAPSLHPYIDPKCNWALHHPEAFPVDVNTAPGHALLRVPGIGPKSVPRILTARRESRLTLGALQKLGVVTKRAQFFICAADLPRGVRAGRETTLRALVDPGAVAFGTEQLSLFPTLAGLPAPEEAMAWLRAAL